MVKELLKEMIIYYMKDNLEKVFQKAEVQNIQKIILCIIKYYYYKRYKGTYKNGKRHGNGATFKIDN